MTPSLTVCCFDKFSDSYGVIVVEEKRFFCTTCKKNTCSHTSVCTLMKNSKDRDKYPDVIQEMIAAIESKDHEATTGPTYTPQRVSYLPIKYERTDDLTAALKMNLQEVLPKDESGYPILAPSVDSCPGCGLQLDKKDPIKEGWVRKQTCPVFHHSSWWFATGNLIFSFTF